MNKIWHVLFIVVFFIACANEEEDHSLVAQPPYDKITDSIKQSPNDADLYYRRGSLLYSNNQFVFAEQDLRTAWQLKPTEQYALSVVTVLKEKNVDSAIIFIQQALNKLPQSVALQVGLARAYQQKNNLDKAISVCNDILSNYQSQLDALLLKAELLQAQNKNAEAIAVLETAHMYAPSDADISYDLAYNYAEAKNPKALSLTDSLIKVDKTENIAKAYYVRATYYKNINDLNNAIKNYDESITLDYNFLDAHLEKGQTLYRSKKYKEAQQTFQLALKVSPSTADFYFWLAKTQEAMGNKEEAKLNYQRAYGLDKTMTEAKEAADKL